MRKFLVFILSAFAFTACNEYSINEVLLESTDISLSLRGNVQYTYNPAKGQIAYDSDRHLYRYADDDLSSWFELKCKTKPSNEGDRIIADLKWASKTSFGNEKDLEFVVKQTDGNGMIWMWNKTKNIGLIVRDFE